jgi:hypothetical protein
MWQFSEWQDTYRTGLVNRDGGFTDLYLVSPGQSDVMAVVG